MGAEVFLPGVELDDLATSARLRGLATCRANHWRHLSKLIELGKTHLAQQCVHGRGRLAIIVELGDERLTLCVFLLTLKLCHLGSEADHITERDLAKLDGLERCSLRGGFGDCEQLSLIGFPTMDHAQRLCLILGRELG